MGLRDVQQNSADLRNSVKLMIRDAELDWHTAEGRNRLGHVLNAL